MTAPLDVMCPEPGCLMAAGRRCRIPSGRHERSPHGARWRAHFAKDEAVASAISEYDERHRNKILLGRLLEAEGYDPEAIAA